MPDLGKKFECHSCGTKFYDLGRPEPICPKCGANQKQAAISEAEQQERLAARKRRKDELKAIEEEDVPVDEDVPAVEFEDELEGAEEAIVGAVEEEPEEDFDDEA